MNGKTRGISAVDDKEAIRRIMRDMAKRSAWYCLFIGQFLLFFGERGNLAVKMMMVLYSIAWYVNPLRAEFSARAVRMLPVHRRNLSKALWLLAAGYPVVLMALFCTVDAASMAYAGRSPGEACGKALLSFSQFLLINGGIIGAAALGMLWKRADPAPVDVLAKDGPSDSGGMDLLGLMATVLFVIWLTVPPYLGNAPAIPVIAINLAVGGAGFGVSYLCREKLLHEHPKSSTEEARRAGDELIWLTPGKDPWSLALLKQMSGTIVWSVCNAGVSFFVCTMIIISPDRPFQAKILLGVIAGAAILNLGGAWIHWNGELRVWRTLPLSRMRLGGAVIAFVTVACTFPWAVVFAGLCMLMWVPRFLAASELLSLLGVFLVAHGVMFAVVPRLLRGSDDTYRSILFAATLVFGAGCVFFSAPLLVKFENLIVIDLRSHGWAWLAAGFVVLCAGMTVSAWHTSRVLRHSDCYGKANE